MFESLPKVSHLQAFVTWCFGTAQQAEAGGRSGAVGIPIQVVASQNITWPRLLSELKFIHFNLYYNLPFSLLTFADCRSQFLLDRLGRCLKLIVSYRGTSSHEFASQFGLEFFIREKTPKPQSARSLTVHATDCQNGATMWKAFYIFTPGGFTQMVTDDFVGAPKPPQSKRKLSALQRSSQAWQRMRRCGSSLTGNLHMHIT